MIKTLSNMLEKGFCRTRILLYTDRIFDSGLTRENTGYKKNEKNIQVYLAQYNVNLRLII